MFILQCNENPILSPRFQPDPLYARTPLPFQNSLLIWRRRERTQIPSLCKVLSSERGLCKAAANKAHLWLRTVSGRFLVTPVTCSILLALQMPLSSLLPRSQYASYTRQLFYTAELKGGEKRGCRQKGCGAQLGFGLGFVKESRSELVAFEQTTDHFYWKSHRGLSIKTLHRR